MSPNADDRDVRGGHDCLDHQRCDDDTCGICHERLIPLKDLRTMVIVAWAQGFETSPGIAGFILRKYQLRIDLNRVDAMLEELNGKK